MEADRTTRTIRAILEGDGQPGFDLPPEAEAETAEVDLFNAIKAAAQQGNMGEVLKLADQGLAMHQNTTEDPVVSEIPGMPTVCNPVDSWRNPFCR